MPEETSKITIIADLLKRDPAYKEVIDQLEERLYNRYMVYLADKPRFNAKASAIPKQYLAQILSFKNTLELNKIAKKYNLSQDQRDAMPAVLWKIFLREAEIKNLPQMLNSELGLNNIRIAYQMALDIAPIYMPVSDYLGDLGMVMKRWQYELPQEAQPTTYNIQPKSPVIASEAKQSQEQSKNAPTFAPAAPIVPPIRPETPTPSSVIPAFSSVIPSTDEESRRLRDSSVASLPQNDDAKISQDDKSKIASPARNDGEQKDEPIARVQETMARISGQMAKIQSPAIIPISPSVIPNTDEESRRLRDSSVASLPQNDDAKISQDDKSKIASPVRNDAAHPDIEPEYLPDTPPTHSANIIDLKNF